MEHMAGLVFTALVLGMLALFGLALAFHLRGKLAAAARGRIEMVGESARVPLIAAFSGWKGVPWLGFASSNLKPTLVLHTDHVECRVIRTREKPYDAISRVDYRAAIGTQNVVLEFSDSLASFAGNTANRDVAREAIRRLAQKGCPLSERARRLLEG